MPKWLAVADCKVLLQSLLSAELSAYRGAAVPFWPAQPDIDSLERLHLASCVNEFFCLYETGTEDRLLMTNSIDDWATLVSDATSETSGLTFRTSGSTGNPVAYVHRWEHIEAEVDSLTKDLICLASTLRVISWLPVHHLYGFMLGVALPAMFNIPRSAVTNAVLPALTDGDLLVTVPPRWDYLAKSGRAWPENFFGVSSAGRLSTATYNSLLNQGVSGLLDIYGCTELGGIATRRQSNAPYQLLNHWQRSNTHHIKRINSDDVMPLQDDVLWNNKRSFLLKGRFDDVVSIGGVNVSITYVVERLRSLKTVADCVVRTTIHGSQIRLKAFVVPTVNEDETAKDLTQAIALWPAAERPVNITYGDAVPKNSVGKLTDW